MVELSCPAVELVQIPFERRSLPGLFARAAGPRSARGTMVHTNGYDSDLTEMFVAHVPAAGARLPHPPVRRSKPRNQPDPRRHLTAPRPENAVGPMLDWALERPDIDPETVVLAGWSFGGFLAPRTAGHETRLAPLIADPGQ